MSQPQGFEDKVGFVWRIADKLRGAFKPHEYGSVVLPLTMMRRLDAVLEPTKASVLAKAAELDARGVSNPAPILKRVAGQRFYNTSPHTMVTLLADDKNIAASLRAYIHAFSPGAVEVLEQYNFDGKITRMDRAGILYPVLGDFADVDLHPSRVSNEAMGYLFEELLRRFSEMSNETAGEHYTPREVIRLMVNLLFAEDHDALTGPAPVRTIYDPAAGTGGMLTVATTHLTGMNPNARLEVFGEEINPETWAIARSELMIRDSDPDHMVLGNSFTQDGFAGQRFDYMLANPPYGVDWKAYADPIKREAETRGFDGRFGAGLPRVSDGSFLFLQHMLSKMKPVADDPRTPWVDGGSRIGIVLSGSPLFSGGAGSGESEIRRWIIENDWLEAIVGLPDQMFYNTGISTYVWILTNRKPDHRTGRVVLVDARDAGTKMRKSLGNKRKELTDDTIKEITRLFADATDHTATPDPRIKVLPNEAFGYARLTVERPLRRVYRLDEAAFTTLATAKAWQAWLTDAYPDLAADPHAAAVELLANPTGTPETWPTEKALARELADSAVDLPAPVLKAVLKAAATSDPDAPAVKAKRGHGHEPDPDLRDQENIPLPDGYLTMTPTEQAEAVRKAAEAHLTSEIHPYVPDAWIDHDKTRIGYEIPFTRHFYTYTPPRPVADIRADVTALENQIQEWMKGLA